MAGMLPGVESARRRRFHHSGGALDLPSLSTHNSTRRSSLGLYATNHDSFISSSSSLQRNMFYKTYPDENIVGAAREAKQRLDEKFNGHKKSQSKSSENKLNCVEGRRRNQREMHINGAKKCCLRKFNWTKLSWKSTEEEECAVCLESLKDGETLIHLSCRHRFHSRCLKPWLDQNSHCPCCRTTIIST